ncbi:hypothetical protein PoB_004813200 [Plakobranchus ocellatus]|uniref:Uncharacterized protein n=1 Tax=Plakobranchus ocellatus TaxID=259542 RepID=A0AAV4BQL3_9GAST|nr:hypothetical protein PoB_004813200 [Plakobranchus ocellatus]
MSIPEVILKEEEAFSPQHNDLRLSGPRQSNKNRLISGISDPSLGQAPVAGLTPTTAILLHTSLSPAPPTSPPTPTLSPCFPLLGTHNKRVTTFYRRFELRHRRPGLTEGLKSEITLLWTGYTCNTEPNIPSATCVYLCIILIF